MKTPTPSPAPVSEPGRGGRFHRARRLLPAIAVLAIMAAACGTAKDPPANAAAAAEARSDCQGTVVGTVRTVAQRVYEEIAQGDITGYAVDRLAESAELIRAVEHGDRKSVMDLLHELDDGQFVNVKVIHKGHVLAAIQRSEAALAPVEKLLKNAKGRTVGKFILSAEGDLGYSGIVKTLTGAHMVMKVGGEQVLGPTELSPAGHGLVSDSGSTYRPLAMKLGAYPSGSLDATLLVPSDLLKLCAGRELSTPAARAETFGYVARRIYHEELEGPKTKEVVKRLEASSKLSRAVAREDRQGIRAVILEYFASHLHVVRVRTYKGSKMVYDLGGPHVIAPAKGDIRDSHGRVFGHFLVSLQDDEGYRKLLNSFTGAQVVLRMGPEVVQTTFSGNLGRLRLPTEGLAQVSFRGVRYEVYSFAGKAFPSGPLYISLLIPG